ncbi:SDR family NAD(P)-dependent oxidoreductase [Flammeovirga pectinis]|uniref:SDR family NAD(P)-dependent oxidoreductase n=1 Tax=Flammeovirga pectinis TaxID=2494373 RepID=A0A3S9NZ74_9BACT|nr:SDR family NAD(P)-dependent oxidoreductase [Flammeovirga pectinis]AZQ61175.1 SDR family NAD(P)-dependent oxidoreductase [Flammeovirga pectinis]
MNILITGSTDGIGKIAAIKLAQEGFHIYLHGRNPEKLAATVAEVKRETKNENISGFIADLSDLGAVKNMADEIQKTVPILDVLINNAGVFKSATTHNSQGLDLRFTVNFLAPYLLTQELLPVLKKSNAPRIINLSSAAQSPINLDTLLGKNNQSENDTYAQSKLALTMWSFHLAAQEKDIITIAVNPGSLLNTNMVKEAYGHHWSSAEKGGNVLYQLAIAILR